MIYTVSLSPSIDYIIKINNFKEGRLNRSIYDKKIIGGKGIIVSKILNSLKMDSVNLGFIGGYTGDFIIDELNDLEIKNRFIRIKEDTRINIKLNSELDTDINTKGPNISISEKYQFLKQIDTLNKKDLVVLAGDIPNSLPKDFYIDIIKLLTKKKISFAINTSDYSLYKSFKYKPLVIKTNILELENIFKTKISNLEEIKKYGRKCIELGCENVIVSLGDRGAVFISDSDSYFSPVIEGEVINTIGCGDSMLGGFIYGITKGMNKIESFRMAIAAATSTAFSLDTGDTHMIMDILKEVEIVQI